MDANSNFYVAGLICAGGVVIMAILLIWTIIKAKIFE